ncbi:MAG: phosphoserine phosphatase SerB, partial [Actinomycetes bacterium]
MASPTLLVSISGRDRPGISTRLLQALDGLDLHIDDVEQVVIRGRLILTVLVSTEAVALPPAPLRARLDALARELGLDVDVTEVTATPTPVRSGRVLVTLLAARLTPHALAAITGVVADLGANVDRLVRMARQPVMAVELDVSGASPEALRTAVAAEALRVGVDVAVQPSGLQRRAKRLVVMDVDSTLVQGEVIEMLAAHAGCEAEVRAVTEAAMRGELDFAASLRERVALLAGLDEGAVAAVREQVQLTPGARTLVRTLRRLGHRVGIVSGGFTQVTDALVTQLGLDFAAANTLEIVSGRLTGRVVGDVVDRAGKATALRRFAAEAEVPLSQTVAIGDGANDLDMIAAAGLGIAFNAKPAVRQAADAALNAPYLDTVLYLLGITREEIEAADRED